ncbi:hypothetical protein Avbf_17743 [Armadillidium vulgare]|nr:hypothetical protein Avbf_17743 [Armadillidium vulgare]
MAFGTNELNEEILFCEICKLFSGNQKVMNKHTPKCKKQHKGKKKVRMCPYNSSHYIPIHKYEKHVEKCMKNHGIENGFEIQFQIMSTHNPEEINGNLATENVSSVNGIIISAFYRERLRNYECIWGLNSAQKEEWKKAEFQRIENLQKKESIGHIKYPRANGTYVTVDEIIYKLNGSIVNENKSTQVCSTAMSLEENSNENASIGNFKTKVDKRKKREKKERGAADSYNFTSNKQSGARKKTNKRGKNQKEVTHSESDVDKSINTQGRKGISASRRIASNIPETFCETFSPKLVAQINKGASDNLSGARKKATQSRKNIDKKVSLEAASIEKDSSRNSGSCKVAQQNSQRRKASAALRPCEKSSNVPGKVQVYPEVAVHSQKSLSNDSSVARTKTISGKIRNESVSSDDAANTNDLKENLNTSSQSDSDNWVLIKKNRRKKKAIELAPNIPEVFNQNVLSASANRPANSNKDITEHYGARKKNRPKERKLD